MEKTCFKCGVTKPLDEFYKHKQMADGHLNKCKACTKADSQARYDEKGDTYIKEYEQRRSKDPARKAKQMEYLRKGRAQNPIRTAARYLTANAMRDGKLVKQPCEVCGKVNAEAHHDDYHRPLDVRWLCRKHHLEEHGKNHWETTF